jgi:hypothetical protein
MDDGLRSARLAYAAASMRAYWHSFMGGDDLIACLENAAASSERGGMKVRYGHGDDVVQNSELKRKQQEAQQTCDSWRSMTKLRSHIKLP